MSNNGNVAMAAVLGMLAYGSPRATGPMDTTPHTEKAKHSALRRKRRKKRKANKRRKS